MPGPLGAAGTAPGPRLQRSPVRRAGLGCGNRAGRSAGHRRESSGGPGLSRPRPRGAGTAALVTQACGAGEPGSSSIAGPEQLRAPYPRARPGAEEAEASEQCPGLCPTLAPLSFLPRALGAVVCKEKIRSRIAPSPARPRCDGA